VNDRLWQLDRNAKLLGLELKEDGEKRRLELPSGRVLTFSLKSRALIRVEAHEKGRLDAHRDCTTGQAIAVLRREAKRRERDG
jgi:hypothetical protein